MSLLHLRNARLAELGEGGPCFWQVWHSLRKDGQVSTTWTMIFCQNIHTDLDYWLRLAVLMKIQWYSTRFFFYPPNWTKLDLTFILNNYQSFRSNCNQWQSVAFHKVKKQCSLNCEWKLRIGEYRENLDRCTDGYVKVYIQVKYMLLQKSGGFKVIKSF